MAAMSPKHPRKHDTLARNQGASCAPPGSFARIAGIGQLSLAIPYPSGTLRIFASSRRSNSDSVTVMIR